ncbi:RAM signaling pathway protein [Seiridium cupressi]|uniref:RAM signaling pathway protein-domain-containing protein n=1 Tax=Seiridium unicorne TaxID=138068 RepID=A0ABR2UIX4_9PEZI
MAGSYSMSSMMPLGANGATVIPSQSAASRGLPTNPAQGLRRLQTSISNMPPPPPIPEKFQQSSSSNLSVPSPMSANKVIALAREAMRSAIRDNESQAAEASGVSTELKPGVTIDLSRRNIQELPDEVVDIIKNELERLALSHNKLSAFPSRFSECTSLRYLNVRNNLIKEFPLPVIDPHPFDLATVRSNLIIQLCNLKSLEILDLGRNKIKVLPPDIAKLASLKVLAVQKNRIEELPLCLGDMVSLQVLKLDGNAITFPPREVLQVQASTPPNEGFLKESEVTEVTVTAHIKKFLKQKIAEKVEAEKTMDMENGNGDDGSEGIETPRFPLKRVVSGRFPIKVNGVDAPDIRSPNVPRPPPIPSRSHARGLSQQNTAVRKPGVMPLTIGNPNERLRSNSETILQASNRADRPTDRQRRMISKRTNELSTLDETQANNRFSHYRGLSHGSSMTGNVHPGMGSIISPNSPAEPLLQRPNYVRRLSVLPEQRRESKIVDPILESAKGILYAIFQIHPMIQLITRLTNDGTAKRSSLEIVFFNTNMHVEELEQEIMKHESPDQDSRAPMENENVQRAVLTLINAYGHICSILLSNMDTIVSNGDPRYIRTLMLCLYNSITELRVTANQTLMGISPSNNAPAPTARRLGPGGTIKPHSRDSSTTPTVDRPSLSARYRNGHHSHKSSNLRVATDVPIPYVNGTGRTATITSATPRSGESFASDGSRYGSDVSNEERHFEKIFLSLSKSTELLMRNLPIFNQQFNNGLREARAQRASEQVLYDWRLLIGRCTHAVQQTDLLKGRLSAIKFKEPGIRTDPGFWALCKSFADAWAEFGSTLKQAMDHQIVLPMDIRARLRPVQLHVKETTQLVLASPWSNIFRNAGQMQDGNYFSPGHYSSNSNMTQAQLPVTPQSAALGPAVQATVPSTPQSASFAHAFSGGVFERADALISMGGLSMSRNGTMTGANHSAFNSISSMTSVPDDRGPESLLSPSNGMGPMSYRRNGGGKPAF